MIVLQKVLDSSALPEDDADQVRGWILSLQSWTKEKKSSTPVSFLSDGERLVSSGLAKRLDGRDDQVLLLRGTALLHKALESDSQKPEARSHALYLLGAAYNRLPMFFAESWSDMYLEQCISEFPGTADAKNAFRVMKESITEEFTGSAVTGGQLGLLRPSSPAPHVDVSRAGINAAGIIFREGAGHDSVTISTDGD